jgi:hypothetical protein
MGITGLVFALYMGRVDVRPDEAAPLLRSLKLLFVTFALLALAGVFVSYARGKVHRSE